MTKLLQKTCDEATKLPEKSQDGFGMPWPEIRKRYPHQWLLLEATKAHSSGGQRIVERLTALATSGIVSGPFAIYPSPFGIGGPFTLIHLPSQAKIIDLRMQSACKDAAEKFAALDLNCGPAIRRRSSVRTSRRCGTSTSA